MPLKVYFLNFVRIESKHPSHISITLVSKELHGKSAFSIHNQFVSIVIKILEYLQNDYYHCMDKNFVLSKIEKTHLTV